MKKSCNNCKALEDNGKCLLSFKNIKIPTSLYLNSLSIYKFKPTEECPKPKTNKSLANLLFIGPGN